MNRRSFLKLSGAAVSAAFVIPHLSSIAPLFIPQDHLEMGVPRPLVTSMDAYASHDPYRFEALVLHSPQALWAFERPIPAGEIVRIDAETAVRWIKNGIAVVPDDPDSPYARTATGGMVYTAPTYVYRSAPRRASAEYLKVRAEERLSLSPENAQFNERLKGEMRTIMKNRRDIEADPSLSPMPELPEMTFREEFSEPAPRSFFINPRPKDLV